jgi:hypothetical protein
LTRELVPSKWWEGQIEMKADSSEQVTRSTSDVVPRSGKARLLTLDGLDRRTAAYRETKRLIDELESDLGGADQLSSAERQIIQHAAVLGALLTDTEGRWIGGEPIDATVYCATINAQRRLFESIGIQRRPRNLTPRLHDYLSEAAE